MSRFDAHRRNFLRVAGAATGVTLLSTSGLLSQSATAGDNGSGSQSEGPADYTLTIAIKPIELAPNRIISATTYNGQSQARYFALKKVSESRSIFVMRQTRPSNCTGTDNSFRPTSTERKSTRLNSSHLGISYAVFCLKKT